MCPTGSMSPAMQTVMSACVAHNSDVKMAKLLDTSEHHAAIILYCLHSLQNLCSPNSMQVVPAHVARMQAMIADL